MDMRHSRKIVQEANYGVYVWELPDGRRVGDDDGNYLSINAMEYDLKKMEILRKAVMHYGIMIGKPVFLAGRRKVSDSEFEEQIARQNAGLIPDEYDIPALLDEVRANETRR